jgi:hypothetical protein
MGVVWEGYDTLLNRSVAVKEVLLPPHLSPAEYQLQLTRTSREARTAARLNHRGIVAIYDVAEQDDRPWIIMELVRARGLDEVGQLPVQQVAEIGRQVLSALRAAHEAGILHRDVKPSNILLDAEGRAVLSDFGIATIEGDSSLTQTGMVTGSPSFLPPERAMGVEAGPWSDLWALGATLYAALVGHGPFERRDAISTLGALLTEEPDFGRVPPAMREVLSGMLQRDPAHRLTAEQTDVLLAEASGDPSAPARRTGDWERRPAANTGVTAAQRSTGATATQRSTGTTWATENTTTPATRGRRRPQNRSRVPLIVAAVVALAVGGGAVAMAMASPEQQPVAQTGPAAVPATPESEETETPSEKPSASPTPKPSKTVAAESGPQLKTWNAKAPENWSIQYPADWAGDWAATGYTQWLRGDGSAHMSVEVLDGSLDTLESLQTSVKDDVARWSDILSEDTVQIPLAYGSGLQWEFTWTMKDSGGVPWASPGVKYHEIRRFVGVGDTVMVLSWTTPNASWNGQQDLMNRVFKSFHPRGGE